MIKFMESPIRKFPPNGCWYGMSLESKRQWLMQSGQAKDYFEASSLLARHGAIVKARRKLRDSQRN